MLRVLSLLVLFTLIAASQDRIVRLEGEPIVGVKVTKETYKRVTYEREGGNQSSVDAENVASVVRADTPSALREGRASFLTGDATDAVRLLENAARAEGAADWVKEYAAFWSGRAHLALGEGQRAVRAFEEVLAIHPDSRLLPMAKLGIAQGHILGGDHEAAKETLDGFIEEVDRKKLARRWSIEAKRLLGQSLASQENWSEAAREHESLLRDVREALGSSEEPDPELGRLALLTELDRGQALIEANRVNDALRSFSGVRADYPDVQGAAAASKIGSALVALARGNPSEARVTLTEVLALHFDEPALLPPAMLYLAEAYLALAEAREPEARQKARTYLETIVAEHPGSDTARQAREMMNKL